MTSLIGRISGTQDSFFSVASDLLSGEGLEAETSGGAISLPNKSNSGRMIHLANGGVCLSIEGTDDDPSP